MNVSIAKDAPDSALRGAGGAAGHPVVFFDGVCGLCNAAVDYIVARDPGGVFRFAPLQGELAARTVRPEDVASLKTLVLWDARGLHRRSTAVWRILWGLGGFQAFLGAMLWCVPWPLRDAGYRLVSSIRYRLFGRKETCRMPSPEERARFLA
jgi:predicted DCC family thiol-disulfide oxidoreductase YuxK